MSTSAEQLAGLVRSGALIPVMVFGTEDCCKHGSAADCESTGYGLCDRFSHHAQAGSDCNRADFFLLRPSDEAMGDPVLREAIQWVLDNDGWPK